MKAHHILCALACASVTASCVVTPPLSEATGSADPKITIADVVQRVKCELAEAFDEKTSQREFLWLAGWTAHVDLTLTINDNAGISPSGSFTQYQANAVNQAAGSSTFPATASRAVVNQFFTVSVGATLSGQAIRTETVSFTVALDELKLWHKRLCNFGSGRDITGSLGLKEWVNSAFFPVEVGQLQAGVHTATAAKAQSVSAPAPGHAGPTAAAEGGPSVEEVLKNLTGWQATLKTLTSLTAKSSAAIVSGKMSIPAAQKSLNQRLAASKQYKYVLAPYLAQRYADASVFMTKYSQDFAICQSMQSLLVDATAQAKKLYDLLKDIGDLNTPAYKIIDRIMYANLENEMLKFGLGANPSESEIKNSQYVAEMQNCLELVQAATDLPNKLPQHLDPPIDSVLHSLTFVINYGASATPSWTLIQWKGPGQTANFASASGVRTHNLVITMGPPSGAAPISTDAIRLIELQAIRSLNQQ